MIRPGDIVIALAGIALVTALGADIYSNGTADTVRITRGDHEPVDYAAWQDKRVSVAGPLGETVVEIHDGRVRVVQSPCTGKICMRAGWLESAGEATACMPNRVSVALAGGDSRYDAINF